MTAPVISVVIPAYNAESWLAVQLEALSAQENAPPFEVVLVDNGSTDGTVALTLAMAKTASHPLRLVTATAYQGPGYARNVGASVSRADLLMFADADDVVSRWWVAHGHRAFQDSLLWSGGATWMEASTMPSKVEEVWRQAGDSSEWTNLVRGDVTDPSPVLMGGDFGCSRAVFERVGGFDQSHGAAYEDNDFAQRAHLAGIAVDHAPSVRIAYRVAYSPRSEARRAKAQMTGLTLNVVRYGGALGSSLPHPLAEVLRVAGASSLMAFHLKSRDWPGILHRGSIAASRLTSQVRFRLLRRTPKPLIGVGYVSPSAPAAHSPSLGAPSDGGTAASVVIPARNAAPFIAEQLASLAQQQGAPAFEVVLADNGSTDDTAVVVRQVADRLGMDVRIVDASGVPSASHARNIGAQAARGDVLLFCDADDLVGSHWVSDLVAAVRSRDDVLVGGALHHERFNTPEVLAAYGIRKDPTADELEAGPRILDPEGGFAGYLHTVPGGNFAIRRTDYLRLRGMDPKYPGGAEETDFAWRAQEAGMTVLGAPRAVVHYRLKQDPAGLFRQQRIQQRGRMYLWTQYRDRGMNGPSAKASLLEVIRSPLAYTAHRAPAARLAWAYNTGAHVGALEGMLRYRLLTPRLQSKG